MVKLVIDRSKALSNTVLVYRPEDRAFGAEPRPNYVDSWVTLNDLELMVDGRDNRVVFVAGYCSHRSWRPARLDVPHFQRGALLVEFDPELTPSVSTSLNAHQPPWPALVDARAGWVCLEKPGARPASELEAAEFAPGCVAVLEDGHLSALWLRPKELPADVSERRLW